MSSRYRKLKEAEDKLAELAEENRKLREEKKTVTRRRLDNFYSETVAKTE